MLLQELAGRGGDCFLVGAEIVERAEAEDAVLVVLRLGAEQPLKGFFGALGDALVLLVGAEGGEAAERDVGRREFAGLGGRALAGGAPVVGIVVPLEKELGDGGGVLVGLAAAGLQSPESPAGGIGFAAVVGVFRGRLPLGRLSGKA